MDFSASWLSTGCRAVTFSVALPPALMDVGVTEALAPLGVPDTLRLIVPPLPTTVVEMVLETLVPCTTVRLPGRDEIWKFGLGAATVSCTVVGCVTDPSVPRPASASLLPYTTPFRSFSVALPPALMDVGVTEALAPLGVPDTARLIVPPLPTTVVEMVLEPLAPCTRLTLLGLAEIVKFGPGAVTVSCTVVVWVTDPSVPVTVSV